MNKLLTFIFITWIPVFSLVPEVEYSDYARSFQYGFENGNLVSNWSFENKAVFWEKQNTELFVCTDISRFIGDINIDWRAVSGNRVLSVKYLSSNSNCEYHMDSDALPIKKLGIFFPFGIPITSNPSYSLPLSQFIPVMEDSLYTISFFYQNDLEAASDFASVSFYTGNKFLRGSPIKVTNYTFSENWRFVKKSFKIPKGGSLLKINFSQGATNSSDSDKYLLIDDVVLEKGDEATSRNDIQEVITFTSPFGETEQVLKKIEVNSTYGGEYPQKCLKGYGMYATNTLDIHSRTRIVSSNLGAQNLITMQPDVFLEGDAKAAKIMVTHRDTIVGNVYASNFSHTNSTVIDGRKKPFTDPICEMEDPIVTPGSIILNYSPDAQALLLPGKYGDANFNDRSTITIHSGEYHFKSLRIGPDSKLVFDLQEGPAYFYIGNSFSLSDRFTMEVTEESMTDFVSIQSTTTNDIKLGTDASIIGLWYMPNARINVYSRTVSKTRLFAKNLSIHPDVTFQEPVFKGLYGSGTYIALNTEFDMYQRPVKAALPHIVELEKPQMLQNSFELANAYYTSQNNMPDAAGYAFSQTQYPNKMLGWGYSWQPGEVWAKDAGNHHVAQTECWVTTLDVLEGICMSEDQHLNDTRYLVSYTKDVNGNYSIKWSNALGQVVKTAVTSEADFNLPLNERQLLIKTYEYFANGKLKREKTPMDVHSGSDDYSTVRTYNERGQLVGVYSPATGLKRYWYSSKGILRFSQTDKQRADGRSMSYLYDHKGRLTETQLQYVGNDEDLIQYYAEMLSSSVGRTRSLNRIAYDSVGACTQAIKNSFSASFLASIQEDIESLQLGHLEGKQVCRLNSNMELYGDLEAQQRAVIDFYSYDGLGRKTHAWKYVGAVQSAADRWRGVSYTWDDLDRLHKVNYTNQAGEILHQKVYHYDGQGQVSHLTDEQGANLVSFHYDDLKQLRTVHLAEGIQIDYQYHLHGAVKQIEATRQSDQQLLFSQKLGYERSAMEGYSAHTKPDGRIRSSLTQLPGITSDPVKLSLYNFDQLGRMVNTTVFTSQQAVAGTFTEAKDQQMYQGFDDNNRTIYRGLGSDYDNTMIYHYAPNTWKLDHVEGQAHQAPDRDMSMAGTFQYDLDENMIYDASKDLTIRYDSDNLPVEFVRDPLEGQAFKQLNLYDYSGERVSSLSWGKVNVGGQIDTPPMPDNENADPADYGDADPQWQYFGAKHYFTIDSRKRSELLERPQQDAAEYVALQGISSQIGRIRPDNTREYYLKNHQGSLIKSVQASGEDMYILDYMPYGFQTLHHATDGDVPSEQYTGKEYDPFLAFYYYGARYFDPVLGMWSVPDPAGQFANPYYFGGDPVNYVDPDGRFIVTALVVGAVVGAYMGAVAETGSMTLKGFDITQDWDEMLVGAAIGAGTAWTGGTIGASAGAWATGSAGLASGSGAVAAIAGGATTGAITGAVGGLGSYTLGQYASGSAGIQNYNAWDATKSTLIGAASGAAMGGIIAGGSYAVSDAYQWRTHETVLDYANSNDRLVDGANYVNSIENGDASTRFVIDENFAKGKSNYNYTKDRVTINKADYTVNGKFSADRFYSTVSHEIGHEPLFKMGGSPDVWQSMLSSEKIQAVNTQEEIITKQITAHKYFPHWSQSNQTYLTNLSHDTMHHNSIFGRHKLYNGFF
jgi:RHS repeat-associated protein